MRKKWGNIKNWTESKKEKVLNITFISITVIFIVISLTATFTRFLPVFGRLWQALRDFGYSIAYYFTELVENYDRVNPTITTIPDGMESILPIDLEEFKLMMKEYGNLLIDRENFLGFIEWIFLIIENTLRIFLLFLMPVELIALCAYMRYNTPNNERGDTTPLTLFKYFEKKVINPIKYFFKRFKQFFENRAKLRFWICVLWIFNLNGITMIIEAFAFLYWFSVQFLGDMPGIYSIFVKFIIDLSIPISFFPLPVWIVLGIIVFNKICDNIGIKRLKKLEKQNVKFLEEHPGALFANGKQRSKKTTLITSFALSEEPRMRNAALELLSLRDLQFPDFPWLDFEEFLQKGIEEKKLNTLAKIRFFVRQLKKSYSMKMNRHSKKNALKYFREKYGYNYSDFVFGYSAEKPMTYNNGIGIVDIFSCIENYGKLYFIYAAKTSLIFGNYSIRTDFKRNDDGNFPLYDFNFFKRNPEDIEKDSRFCHQIDFDSLRLGKVKDSNNPNKDGLDIGIVNIQEVAKERGNKDTRIGKASDEKVNQRNDGFEVDIKMHGHAATVDNFTFFRVFMDDQRAGSLSADDKDLSDTLYIKDVSKAKIVRPCAWIIECIYAISKKIYQKTYYWLRNRQGKNTLFCYLIKKLFRPISNRYIRMSNMYSVYTMTLHVEDGSSGEVKDDKYKYYISTKKVYSGRFATDSINEFYSAKGLSSENGLNDFKSFDDLHPSIDSLKYMHSHFYDAIIDQFDIESRKVKVYGKARDREIVGTKVLKKRDS